jgi:hypothetical protein
MKAAARLCDQENDALEWATDFFRNCRLDMTPDGTRRASIELGVNTLLFAYDFEVQNRPKDLDSATARLVNKASGNEVLPRFAAALIERGDKLPPALKDFVVAFLRDPSKWQMRKRGRWKGALTVRDSNIGAAVGFVAAKWKFSATRNREQKISRACAASIVREAIANGAGLHLSEADVVKAWNRFRRQMAGTAAMTVGNGELLIMTRDYLRRKNLV